MPTLLDQASADGRPRLPQLGDVGACELHELDRRVQVVRQRIVLPLRTELGQGRLQADDGGTLWECVGDRLHLPGRLILVLDPLIRVEAETFGDIAHDVAVVGHLQFIDEFGREPLRALRVHLAKPLHGPVERPRHGVAFGVRPRLLRVAGLAAADRQTDGALERRLV